MPEACFTNSGLILLYQASGTFESLCKLPSFQFYHVPIAIIKNQPLCIASSQLLQASHWHLAQFAHKHFLKYVFFLLKKKFFFTPYDALQWLNTLAQPMSLPGSQGMSRPSFTLIGPNLLVVEEYIETDRQPFCYYRFAGTQVSGVQKKMGAHATLPVNMKLSLARFEIFTCQIHEIPRH